MKPLWTCPRCGRPFANRNQWHSCGRWTLEQHLDAMSPTVRALYERFVELVELCGPFMFAPAKTRIGFQVRMTFADVVPQKTGLHAYVILARRLEHARFTRIEALGPRNHVHHFRITDPRDLDDEVLAWLREAYEVGEQKHLDTLTPPPQ